MRRSLSGDVTCLSGLKYTRTGSRKKTILDICVPSLPPSVTSVYHRMLPTPLDAEERQFVQCGSAVLGIRHKAMMRGVELGLCSVLCSETFNSRSLAESTKCPTFTVFQTQRTLDRISHPQSRPRALSCRPGQGGPNGGGE